MANAINKYPWNEWSHEIIDSCDTLEKANELETYYIKLYKSSEREFGYNITAGGDGHTGQAMSENTKYKLSEAIKELWKDESYASKVIAGMKGRPMHENTKEALIKANLGRKCTPETKCKISKANGRPVLQFSLDGDFICEYDNCVEASHKVGVTHSAISNCCIQKSKKCSNYIFMYKDEYSEENLTSRIEAIKSRKKSAKKVSQYDKEDNFINNYESITDASEKTSISITCISNCLKGLSKTAGGYKWKYNNGN